MVCETSPPKLQIPTNMQVGESSKPQSHSLQYRRNQHKNDISNEQDTIKDPDFCIWYDEDVHDAYKDDQHTIIGKSLLEIPIHTLSLNPTLSEIWRDPT